MNKRPLSVTILGCLYIATGAFRIAFHLTEFSSQHPFQHDIVWVALVRLIAIVCGAFMLRGRNWARWLALAWVAFHVILSAFQSSFGLVMHGLFCAAFAYILFRPQASQYFRPGRAQAI